MDDRHPSKPIYLNNLGLSQEPVSDASARWLILENAIFNQQKGGQVNG